MASPGSSQGFWAACARIGDWSARHWGRVFLVWLLLIGGAIAGASSFSDRLKGGIGSVPGSDSEAVERLLYTEFDSPFAQFLLVVLAPPEGGRVDPSLVRTLSDSLLATPGVSRVMPWPTPLDRPAILVVGLEAATLEEAEHLVVPVRAVVRSTRAAHPEIASLVTGQPAFNVDLALHSAEQSSAGERRVLPLTLLALLLSFGALGAAMAPLVSGAAAVLLALGLVSLLAALMPLSAYAANIATMLGLGLGIDYALFVVARIREEARHSADARASVRRAIRHAAPAIVGSAGTVLIGLVILASVPVQDMVGIGIGGAVVALTSALAGITLLPALAASLGRWLEAPRWLSNRLGTHHQEAWWEARARWVVSHPRRSVVLATVGLVLLALPLSRLELGFPEAGMFPARMEAIRGLGVLDSLEMGGASRPLVMMVTLPPGEQVLSRAPLVGLTELTARLRQDPRVQDVLALADPERGAAQLILGASLFGPEQLRPRLPEAGGWLVSRDGRRTYLQVVLRQEVTTQAATRFSEELARLDRSGLEGLGAARIQMGGMPGLQSDLTLAARQAMPRIVVLVVLATLLMLFAMTRSWLIPLKAVLANLLTVAAALGVTVALFRSAWGAAVLGLEAPVTVMAPGIPMIVFCVVFGLSMDYEVFLISRMREAYLDGAPNTEAVVRGLATSGGVITSAAVIMALVFGGFALTELLPIQMLGVALACGVVLDATVVRLWLVPGLMVLAGRYNWLPGDRSGGQTPKDPLPLDA